MANYNPFLEQSNENKKFGTSAIKDRTLSMFNTTRVNYILNWTLAANSNTLTIVDTSATANTYDVYAVRISDERGNEALGYLSPAAPATPVVMDTAALVKTDDWKIDVFVQKGRGTAADYSFQSNTLVLEGAKSSLTGKIDEFWSTGTLNLQLSTTVNGVATLAKVTVADSDTEVLAGTAIGDQVVGTVYLQNTGTSPFVITSVSITGDATAGAGQSGFTPLPFAPGAENEQWQFVIDCAIAQLYAVVVTVLNTTTNDFYVISVETTTV